MFQETNFKNGDFMLCKKSDVTETISRPRLKKTHENRDEDRVKDEQSKRVEMASLG